MALIRAASVRHETKRSSGPTPPPARCRSPPSKTISSRGVYENLAWFYDFTFGPALHPGRVDAIQRMGIKPGDRVLEVGVGTGINAALYPRDCAVTGIDLSSSMLEKARERIARKGVRNVRLLADGRRGPEVRRRHLRHRLRAVPDQRRARSGRGGARDAPRLPARRPHHHPESLPQQEPRSARGSNGASRRSPCTSASSPISTCRRSSRRPS